MITVEVKRIPDCFIELFDKTIRMVNFACAKKLPGCYIFFGDVFRSITNIGRQQCV